MSDENIHAQFFKLGWDAAKEDSKDEIALLSAEVDEKDRLLACFRTRFSELSEEFSEMAREGDDE